MTTKQKAMPSTVQQKWIDAFSKRDVKAYSAIYAQDAVIHDPMYPQPLKTRAEIEKDFMDFVKAFPDITVKFNHAFEKDQWAALDWQMAGTHKGPLTGPQGTIAATNKRIDFRGALIYKINPTGLVTEQFLYYDTAALSKQLGIATK